MGLGFHSWNFQEVPYKLAEFPGVKDCFLWNFQFQEFSKKSISSPLLGCFIEQPNFPMEIFCKLKI